MPSINTILRTLLEADDKIAACNLHHDLREDVIQLWQWAAQPGEIDHPLLCEHLRTLTGKIPDDCRPCSQVASELFDMEQEIRVEIATPLCAEPPDIKLPPENLLRTRIKNNYPFPIAISYSQACELDDDIRINMHKIIDTFELSFRYCVYILMEYATIYEQDNTKKKSLQNMWKSLSRVSLGFSTGLGGILITIRKICEIQNKYLRDLLESIYGSQEYINKLVEVRNRISHRPGLYLSEFTPNDIVQNFSELKVALEKFLWKIQVISKMPLIYLIRPINFDEQKRNMKYKIALCMGDREIFLTDDAYLGVRNLYENMKVCLCLEDIDKEGIITDIMPLYPLLETFPNPRGRQVYMYLDFDSSKEEHAFVHPFDIQFVTNRKHPIIFNELETRVRHGIIR